MAKRKSDWQAVGRPKQLGVFFDSIRAEARERFGDEQVLTGTESEKTVIGLPFPKGAFCLCWLFCNTVWPLSRVMQITGEEGSCKSALLFEVFRWFWYWGGGSVFIEAEAKDSPDLRHSIVGDDANQDITVHRCGSLEDWQSALRFYIEDIQRKCQLVGGAGRTVPVCFGIDSLMGRAARETQMKVEEKGYADRAHPLEALKIATYMRVMPDWIREWPFCVIGTNHLKPDTSSTGFIPTKRSPGGKSIKFQETFEIEMKRIGDIELVDRNGIKLQLLARKNSLGQSRRELQVNMCWRYEVVDGVLNQATWWDWGGASIDLLLSYIEEKGEIPQAVRDIIDLHPSKQKRRVWSDALDIPESDPLPYEKAAEKLSDMPKVLTELYNFFGVRQRHEFQPSRDYRDQLDEIRKKTQEASGDGEIVSADP